MKIGIIGCGNMGQALLKGILAKGYANKKDILCCDKERKKLNALYSRFGVGISSSNREIVKKCSVIILAVKPQDAHEVLADASLTLRGKLLISICAGITTRSLQRYLGKVPVVRIMPNMPAQIAQGISAMSLGRYATAKDQKVAMSIFSCVGEVVKVKEELIDAVTAISGSGPAYFFYLVERLMHTAEELGISRKIAQRLAIKTALGSALMMERMKQNPQNLRAKVTSKGGTTQAAFNVFKRKALDKILAEAIKAAARRSKELEVK